MAKNKRKSDSNVKKSSINKNINKTLKSVNNIDINIKSDAIIDENETHFDSNNNSNDFKVSKRGRKPLRNKLKDQRIDNNSNTSENCVNGLKESVSEENVDKNIEKLSQTTNKDLTNSQINTKEEPIDGTLRRSNRIRKATQLYSQEIKPKISVKSKKVKSKSIKSKTISEELNENNSRLNEIEETLDLKRIVDSMTSQKTTKRRRSIGRKSITKSKFRYRKSLSNYKKLNFVEKGNLEILHKKLGLMSKRLSIIPETREYSEESD
jgi:hypothetical protein